MNKGKTRVFEVACPDCKSKLWIDSVTREVIKSEKCRRQRGSLDDMLLKEKKRTSEFSHKFEATAELQKEKKKKAEEKFRAAFNTSASEKES